MIETTFNPKQVEPRWSEAWERSGAFKPKSDPGAETFCIVIPPPNVTGSLHIGHALNNTLQDILIRFERMRGKARSGCPAPTTPASPRRWWWSASSPKRRQHGPPRRSAAKIRRSGLGSGRRSPAARSSTSCGGWAPRCDWTRERFTLDEGLSAAVRKVFVQLHKEGLIYRDKRLVNWDPHFQTAISDLEVENREVERPLLAHIRLSGGRIEPGRWHRPIATTRPRDDAGRHRRGRASRRRALRGI